MSRIQEPFDQPSLAQSTELATRPAARELEPTFWHEPLNITGGGADLVDARRLLHVLLDRKWQILFVVLLVVVPAAIATLRQERLYQSSTLLEVAADTVQVLPYRDVTSPTVPASFNLVSEMARETEMLRGSAVTSRVAERLKAHPDSEAMAPELGRLRGHMSVAPLPNTRMMRLSYLAWRPDVAAAIANIWAEEFIKANFDARQETRLKARQLLQRELATLERQVQASEQALVRYAQVHGLDPADAKVGSNDLAQVKLSTLAASVTAAETAVIEAQSRLDMLANASVENFPDKLMTETIGGRQTALLQLEHDLTGLTSTFGPSWPAVIQKRNEVALVREQLDREKNLAIMSARQQARLEYQAADGNRRMLATEKAGQEKVVAVLQNATVEYSNIRREVQTNEKLYEGLLERLKQTEVTPGLEFENVRVIEQAQIRRAAAQPNVRWNLFLALTLGVALGVGVAFGLDFWNDTLSSAEEAERLTRFPVLGSIPLLNASTRTQRMLRTAVQARDALRGIAAPLARRVDQALAPAVEDRIETSSVSSPASGAPSSPVMENLAGGFHADGDVSEAVRSICASVLLSRSEHAPKTLLVTSALPGEGKTTLARQLGRAFAETGCRTLLVECDMRRPTFEKTLGIGSEGGLSLFLAGHIDHPMFHQLLDDRLVVVAAGPSAPNPVALLHSDRMRAFLSEMSRTFQFVILDAPPVLPIADARMLGALSEGVVLVVRAGVTSRKDVQRACAALDAGSSRLLGMVLNGTRATGSHAAYYEEYLDYRSA